LAFICRISAYVVLRILPYCSFWAFCIMRFTECQFCAWQCTGRVMLPVWWIYFQCMDATCAGLLLHRCAKMHMDGIWIQMICPREKESA
jgi:hypothetical protein